ncbi:hypothetical protein AC579_2331 [Pseudocercospora musae]|uniref:Uncharacterized protein n=1 Tax=Pseudocercospora musae TaxID=113226 RepID=A0A139H3R4_9PEZI|nr:hypothetical protein AC579_2331 [Pseudocercospora musae]
MCLPVVWLPWAGSGDDLAPTKEIDTATKQPDRAEQKFGKTAAHLVVSTKAITPQAKLKVPHTPKRQRTTKNDDSKDMLDSDGLTIDWKLDSLAYPPPLTPQERASFDAQMMPPPSSAASATPKRKRETKHSTYYEAWDPPSPSSFLGMAHTKSMLRKHNSERAPWVVVSEALKKRRA